MEHVQYHIASRSVIAITTSRSPATSTHVEMPILSSSQGSSRAATYPPEAMILNENLHNPPLILASATFGLQLPVMLSIIATRTYTVSSTETAAPLNTHQQDLGV